MRIAFPRFYESKVAVKCMFQYEFAITELPRLSTLGPEGADARWGVEGGNACASGPQGALPASLVDTALLPAHPPELPLKLLVLSNI